MLSDVPASWNLKEKKISEYTERANRTARMAISGNSSHSFSKSRANGIRRFVGSLLSFSSSSISFFLPTIWVVWKISCFNNFIITLVLLCGCRLFDLILGWFLKLYTKCYCRVVASFNRTLIENKVERNTRRAAASDDRSAPPVR